MTSFSSLGVPEALVGTLATSGVTDAFPIQAATLPDTLRGRDVLGRGRTGSGKTLVGDKTLEELAAEIDPLVPADFVAPAAE